MLTIEQQIQALEIELHRQRTGHQCAWTSNNIALILDAISELRKQLPVRPPLRGQLGRADKPGP